MASVYLRGKTYWIIYYENGKKVQHSLKTKDKTVAKYKKNQVENKLVEGESPSPRTNTPAHDILTEYISHCKNRISEKSSIGYMKYIKDYLDSSQISRLHQINEHSVKNHIDNKIRAGASPGTANHIIKFIKQFLNYATRRNYLSKNPIQSMALIKIDRMPPRFLSKVEVNTVLDNAKDETLHPMIATAVYTGMRLGELLRLQPEDIDFTRKTVTVMISKSKKFRVVPLHPELEKTLKSKGAVPFDFTNNRRVFGRIKKKSKLPNIGWHTFRHTFASQLVMSGVDIVTVSKLLGHADISTTQIYSHLSESHIRESIKRLNFV